MFKGQSLTFTFISYLKRQEKTTSKTKRHRCGECDSIDLFSLYALFSHFRPRDATRGNSFFLMSSYARANVRITNEQNKRKIPMRASRGLQWENKMYKLKRSIATSRPHDNRTRKRFGDRSVIFRTRYWWASNDKTTDICSWGTLTSLGSMVFNMGGRGNFCQHRIVSFSFTN